MTQRILAVSVIRAAIAVLACTLALLVEWQRPGLTTRIDEGLRDAFLQYAADREPEERLIVIDISEETLREIGPWPWPRGLIADLAESLLGPYGAKAVGLDIVFPDPGGGAGDARLAALAAHAPLTLAQIFDYTPRIAAIRQGTPGSGRDAKWELNNLPAHGHIANHAGLAGAPCIGNIGFQPDSDGVLRRIPARTRYEGRDYLHFASALLACSGDNAPYMPPTDRAGLWRIPYTRALSAYTVIPAADILKERVPRTLVADRYALVGSSSLSLGDRVSTPLAPLTAGVMVHAASLTSLLDLAENRYGPPWSGYRLLAGWSILSVALAVICIARLSAWSGVLLILALVAGWLGIGFAGIARQAEWSVSAPLSAYFVLLVVAIPHEWWQAQRRSSGLLATLAHYVAQPVLDELLRRNLKHSLEPNLCEVTVLVADMENYTATTSSLSLQDAATLTKSFLACLTRPVLSGSGTLDKYTGDGLVAFWGAPLPYADQADRAVSAALDILHGVDALNAERMAAGFAPVRVRIGIESGPALVGDLGTDFRSTYTAVGDCINFASRLEAAARDLPSPLAIGPTANGQLRKHRTVSLGSIALRGTRSVIEVFTVAPAGSSEPATPPTAMHTSMTGQQEARGRSALGARVQ